jgi:hypothetical protein
MTDDEFVRDQILSIVYQMKLQGVDVISAGQILLLLGVEPDQIEDEQFDIMLSMSDENEVLGELATARLSNNVH